MGALSCTAGDSDRLEAIGRTRQLRAENSMRMRALLLIAAVTFVGSEVRLLGQEKAEEGFRSLFDGKTLQGWEVMHKAKFVAEEGVVKLHGGSGARRDRDEFSMSVSQTIPRSARSGMGQDPGSPPMR